MKRAWVEEEVMEGKTKHQSVPLLHKHIRPSLALGRHHRASFSDVTTSAGYRRSFINGVSKEMWLDWSHIKTGPENGAKFHEGVAQRADRALIGVPGDSRCREGGNVRAPSPGSLDTSLRYPGFSHISPLAPMSRPRWYTG